MLNLKKVKETLSKIPWWGWVGIGGGTLLLLGGGSVYLLDGSALDEKLFRLAIAKTHAAPFVDVILAKAKKYNVSPVLVYAIGAQESGWGVYLDADLTGDGGHGHGYMQIDDKTWGSWLDANDWKDPDLNVDMGLYIYTTTRDELASLLTHPLDAYHLAIAALAAYNHGASKVANNINAGRDVDTGTTGNKYSASVMTHYNHLVSLIA